MGNSVASQLRTKIIHRDEKYIGYGCRDDKAGHAKVNVKKPDEHGLVHREKYLRLAETKRRADLFMDNAVLLP